MNRGEYLVFLVGIALLVLPCRGAEFELIRDPHFQRGFFLLDPKPGQRTVSGEVSGWEPGRPEWDLAQWSSRYPLQTNQGSRLSEMLVWSNQAKSVVTGRLGGRQADVTLAVNASTEYPRARKTLSEPWVHLLVQQDLRDAPALGSMGACNFHCEARLTRSVLTSTNDYSPGIHAAQFLIYLTVANRNSKAPGYQECFWFGIPVYDNRHARVPTYEAQDFGGTTLFIYTEASDTFTSKSTHSGEWVVFEKDLLPLFVRALEQARKKGFIKGSADLRDYRPMGIFIGWEVPGMFDVSLECRNLSLKAITP